MREVASSQPRVGGVKRGRQIVYDSEDEEEDRNSKCAKPAPGYYYIKPIIFKNMLLLVFIYALLQTVSIRI